MQAPEAPAADPEARKVHFFSEKSRHRARQRFHLEQDLRRAIDNEEFVLNFQPLVNLRAASLVGAEALIRWQHPEHGLLSPQHFLPLAEQTGLIDPLSRWVLRSACSHLQQWRDSELAPVRLAINLSAHQVQDPRLIHEIDRALSERRLAAARLEVEVTETVAMGDIGATRNTLSALREMGVRVAIDDFGSGFSSLSHLQRLPFDKLKIDREFISGVDRSRKATAICKAIIELAHGMETEVLAEGVETEAEVRCLSALGCGAFQGYYFARPVTAQVLERLAAKPEWNASLQGYEVAAKQPAWAWQNPAQAAAV